MASNILVLAGIGCFVGHPLAIATQAIDTRGAPPADALAAGEERVLPRGAADPAMVRRLGQFVRTEDPQSFERIWALAGERGPLVFPELQAAFDEAPGLTAQLVFLAAMGRSRASPSERRLRRVLEGGGHRPEHGVVAALALGALGGPEAARVLQAQARTARSGAVRVACLLALARLGEPPGVEPSLGARDIGHAAAEILAAGPWVSPEVFAQWIDNATARPGPAPDGLRARALALVAASRADPSLAPGLHRLLDMLEGGAPERVAAAFAWAAVQEASDPDLGLMDELNLEVAGAFLVGFAHPGAGAFREKLAVGPGAARPGWYKRVHRAVSARGGPLGEELDRWLSLADAPLDQAQVGRILALRILAEGPPSPMPFLEELVAAEEGAWVAAAAGLRAPSGFVLPVREGDVDAWLAARALEGALRPGAVRRILEERLAASEATRAGFLHRLRRDLEVDLLCGGSDFLQARRRHEAFRRGRAYLPDGVPASRDEYYRVVERLLAFL